jgi:hypothetical protein
MINSLCPTTDLQELRRRCSIIKRLKEISPQEIDMKYSGECQNHQFRHFLNFAFLMPNYEITIEIIVDPNQTAGFVCDTRRDVSSDYSYTYMNNIGYFMSPGTSRIKTHLSMVVHNPLYMRNGQKFPQKLNLFRRRLSSALVAIYKNENII